jgi:Leucine rich repeat variant
MQAPCVLSVEDADSAARRIASKLDDLVALHAALGEADPALLPFAKLDEAGLREVEERLGVALPAAYRALALHVGTEGAGPEHGLLGAGVAMPGLLGGEDEEEEEKEEGGGASAKDAHGVAPDPRRPFPLEAAWMALDDDGAPRALQAATAHPHDGAMKLAELGDEGDGCFAFLVLAGPHAGEVWEDRTAEGGAIAPVAPLLTWYEAWLDELLVDGMVEAMRRAMPPVQTSPADETLQRWGQLLDERAEAQRGGDGLVLAAQALWKLYQGHAAEAEALIARVEELPAEQAARLPEGMSEALTLWSHGDDAAAAMGEDPTAERLMTHGSWRIRRLLASNPRTPSLALGWLAGDAQLEVRCAVVSNPGASPEVLREAMVGATTLWRARADHLEALFVLDLLARHPSLPHEELGQLAGWAEAWPAHRTAPWVVRAVAGNPATSAPLLAKLSRHAHPCVREAVARRRDATAMTLAGLAADADATVREAVAGNPTTPSSALATLAADASERVRYRVAGRAGLPAQLQRQLAGDFATAVLLALGERDELDGEAAELLALRPPIVLPGEEDDILHDGPYQAEAPEPEPGSARHGDGAVPALDLEIFPHAELSTPAEEAVFDRRPGAALVTLVTGRALAQPGYPAPLLAPLLAPLRAWLASEEGDPAPQPSHPAGNLDDLIAYASAAHPWLEKDAMRILAHASYAPARARLAAHPALSPAIFALLLEDTAPMVQRRLALRPDAAAMGLPLTLIESWTVSEQAESRAAAAACPLASGSVLTALGKDREAFVRRELASNPGAGDELVAALATDEDPEVRAAITWRPTVAAALLETLAGDADGGVAAWARWRQARERTAS